METSLTYHVGKDLHYKEAVTSLGNKKTITCSQDIYSETGAKLVAKGAKIDSKVYAKLIKHKLQQDLDENITLDEPITLSTIFSDITALVSSSQTLSKISDDIPDAPPIKALLRDHVFPNNIALKLTVLKSERRSIYNHTLTVLYLAYYQASKADLDKETITTTVLAALFHDLGLIHIDPRLFKDNRKLTNNEHKFLHVHVIISHLLLAKHPVYQPDVTTAVIEHHERLDGSGYPSGMRAGAISIPGQILAIAVVMSSKFNDAAECFLLEELSLLLTMNSKKLNSEFYKPWQKLFMNNEPNNEGKNNYSDSSLVAEACQLNKIIKEWLSIARRLPSSILIDFIGSYVDALNNNLLQSGMNIDSPEHLISMIDQDRTVGLHFSFILKEASWQLNNLLAELNRRKLYQQTQQDTQLGPWLNSVLQHLDIEYYSFKGDALKLPQ